MWTLLGRCLSYLKTAAMAMLWAALAFASYALIRRSTVAEVIALGVVSVIVSLAILLPLFDYFSRSHRIRQAAAAVLARLAALLRGLPPEGEYETVGLVAAAKHRPVHCRRVDGLAWAEIDDETHLARASGLFPPRAARKD